jgi:hypothetical protein
VLGLGAGVDLLERLVAGGAALYPGGAALYPGGGALYPGAEGNEGLGGVCELVTAAAVW